MIKNKLDIGRNGFYECITERTESLCNEIITLANYSKNTMNIDKLEEHRRERIKIEIELINEHKSKCRDFTTMQRMNKTIKHLKLLIENPDVYFH